MRQYNPPPVIWPLVQMADMDMLVKNVTALLRVMMMNPSIKPASPMTQVTLRNNIMPLSKTNIIKLFLQYLKHGIKLHLPVDLLLDLNLLMIIHKQQNQEQVSTSANAIQKCHFDTCLSIKVYLDIILCCCYCKNVLLQYWVPYVEQTVHENSFDPAQLDDLSLRPGGLGLVSFLVFGQFDLALVEELVDAQSSFASKIRNKEIGQWLGVWRSWQSGSFRFQRSTVQIQSSARIYIEQLLY